jgi:hypothetical protein
MTRTKKATPTQQAAHQAVFHNHEQPFVQPAETGYPTRSWWTETRDRAEFDRIAATEAERMKQARFARPRDTQMGGVV